MNERWFTWHFMRLLLAATVLATAAVAGIDTLAKDRNVLPKVRSVSGQAVGSGELRSLARADAWLNSPPLTEAGLRGKVVLVQFWTYTCINWLRTEPYIRAWAEKYKAQGLVVIGVHAPEFPFEKNLENVRSMVKDLNVGYPVAVDNDHAIWRGFDNNYWPALYLLDAQGQVRYRHFGEGEYQESERAIQQLLTEVGSAPTSRDLVSVQGQGAEAPADWGSLRSQENYLGLDRTEGFASPGGAAASQRQVYAVPARLRLNQWALSGEWTMAGGSIALHQAHGKIVYRFHARDLHLVMGPAIRGRAVRFRVLIDGLPPGAGHGSDTDDQGYGTLDQQRMYQLIRQQGGIGDRQFEIEFLDSGVEVFAFTFG